MFIQRRVKKLVEINISKSKKVYGESSAYIKFPYNNKLVEIIRKQTKRYWDADKKCWEVSTDSLPQLLNEMNQVVSDIQISGEFKEPIEDNINIDIPKDFKFKTKPFKHQIEGFQYGLNNNNFILGDEQGLGKTKQVIDIAIANRQLKNYKHCLIICGVNSLKWNWKAEISVHSNETAWILGSKFKNGKHFIGSTADKLADLNNLGKTLKNYFIITNVESLRDSSIHEKLIELCNKKTIQMIAVDEMHKCKNPSSIQGKAIMKLIADTQIAMTGTPIMNKPLDAFVPLKWLNIETHNFTQFKRHYCVLGGYGGYEIVAYKNLNDLQKMLKENMLRRLKKDVLDLPEKIYVNEYVEMGKEQTKIYKEVFDEIKYNIDKIKACNNPLAEIIRLRQATGYPGILSSKVKDSAKLDRMVELVDDIVENNGKCIIFSNWTQITNEVFIRLEKYNPAIITGDTKDSERSAQQDKFMKDPDCKVIIGTIGAMGTGLTLTAATAEIFLDEPWNRANKEQAEDRGHRIGTKTNVTIYTLLSKDTIDEKINSIVYNKGKMADMLVDGKVEINQKEILDFLLS